MPGAEGGLRPVLGTARVAVASDHGGFSLKGLLLESLRELGHVGHDLGPQDERPCDWPERAHEVALAVAEGRADLGVVIDTVGIGSAMAANKVPGVRAANCWNEAVARNAREHNHANVLVLGSRHLTPLEAHGILAAFLATRQAGAGTRAEPGCSMGSRLVTGPEASEGVHDRRTEARGAPRGGGAPPRRGRGDLLDDLDGGRCVDLALRVCPEDLQAAVQAGACRLGMCGSDPARIGDLASHIDHTLLKPDATAADIDQICAEALENRFASVCVNSSWVRRCAEILSGSGVLVCTVVGFPLGACSSRPRPTRPARHRGRRVRGGHGAGRRSPQVGGRRLRPPGRAWRGRDLSPPGARLKVILETCLLTPDEIVRASRLCREAGADFVKTSTGFSSGGATVEDVALMRQTVGAVMGVKAPAGSVIARPPRR